MISHHVSSVCIIFPPSPTIVPLDVEHHPLDVEHHFPSFSSIVPAFSHHFPSIFHHFHHFPSIFQHFPSFSQHFPSFSITFPSISSQQFPPPPFRSPTPGVPSAVPAQVTRAGVEVGGLGDHGLDGAGAVDGHLHGDVLDLALPVVLQQILGERTGRRTLYVINAVYICIYIYRNLLYIVIIVIVILLLLNCYYHYHCYYNHYYHYYYSSYIIIIIISSSLLLSLLAN